MSHPKVFADLMKGGLPIYVQRDALPRDRVDLIISDIENNGGIVTSTPSAAIVIVIIDRTTTAGSRLVAEYAGDNTIRARRAVVRAEWVTSCLQHEQILGPPGWGGHGLHRHTLQSFFGRGDGQEPDSNTRVLVQEDHPGLATTADLEPSPDPYFPKQSSSNLALTLLHPLPFSATSAPAGPVLEDEEDVKPTLSTAKEITERADGGYQRSHPHAAPVIDTSSTSNARSSKVQMVARHTGTSKSSSGTTREKGTISQRDVWSGRSLDSPIDVNEVMSPTPPPTRDQPSGKRLKFTDKEVDYLIRYYSWAWRPGYRPSTAQISEWAAAKMTWHKESSIQNYIRNNPELFGNSDKSKQPGHRSKKALSEHRANQEVCHVSWQDDRVNESDGETSDNSSTSSLESDDEDEEDPDGEEDMEDTKGGENGDLNSKSGRSDASCDLDTTYNPDDDDELTYSEGSVHGTFEVEGHSGTLNEGKGKAPSTLSKAVVQTMVKTLKENPNALYRSSNSEIRWKLWAAFAKSNPNHSAQAYFGYHEANHSELERLATKHLNKPMPLATNSVHSQIGMERAAATKFKPTTPKRPFVEDRRSGRPEKKARFLPQALSEASLSRRCSDSSDHWLDSLKP